MHIRARFASVLLALAVAAGLITGCREDAAQRVLLISLDGFRWDYRSGMTTPTLDAIAAAGVSAGKLQPAFPSLTFPNHFTLVTGLVPDHHGVVSNTMRDPQIPGAVFTLRNRDAVMDPRWWEAEPIWTRLEKQGRTTAAMLWPGSEAPIGGVMSDHWMTYEQDLTDEQRIALVTRLFEKPEADWPDFTTLYWHDVDTFGHRTGPGSREVREAVERIDGALGQLRDRLRALGALESLNVIVVSDHGMSQLAPDRVIYLEDYLDLAAVETLGSSPNVGIYPVSLTVDQVYARLADKHPRLRVFRKGGYPPRMQFGTHRRVPPISVLADEGWAVYPSRSPGRAGPTGGAHGYDNEAESMQGLFVAAGPSLKRGVAIERFRAVDVYELMCAILGVTPAANDGSRQAARALLRKGDGSN